MNGGAKKISSEYKILENGPKLDETEYEIKIDKKKILHLIFSEYFRLIK